MRTSDEVWQLLGVMFLRQHDAHSARFCPTRGEEFDEVPVQSCECCGHRFTSEPVKAIVPSDARAKCDKWIQETAAGGTPSDLSGDEIWELDRPTITPRGGLKYTPLSDETARLLGMESGKDYGYLLESMTFAEKAGASCKS